MSFSNIAVKSPHTRRVLCTSYWMSSPTTNFITSSSHTLAWSSASMAHVGIGRFPKESITATGDTRQGKQLGDTVSTMAICSVPNKLLFNLTKRSPKSTFQTVYYLLSFISKFCCTCLYSQVDDRFSLMVFSCPILDGLVAVLTSLSILVKHLFPASCIQLCLTPIFSSIAVSIAVACHDRALYSLTLYQLKLCVSLYRDYLFLSS
jgi:hypothetical protein